MAERREASSQRFTVTLPDVVVERLDRIAQRRGSSRATVLREAVMDWLERQPPEPTPAYDPGNDADVEQG